MTAFRAGEARLSVLCGYGAANCSRTASATICAGVASQRRDVSSSRQHACGLAAQRRLLGRLDLLPASEREPDPRRHGHGGCDGGRPCAHAVTSSGLDRDRPRRPPRCARSLARRPRAADRVLVRLPRPRLSATSLRARGHRRRLRVLDGARGPAPVPRVPHRPRRPGPLQRCSERRWVGRRGRRLRSRRADRVAHGSTRAAGRRRGGDPLAQEQRLVGPRAGERLDALAQHATTDDRRAADPGPPAAWPWRWATAPTI